MEEVGVRELKTNASELIRHVREEGKSYAITYRGRRVARLSPAVDLLPLEDEMPRPEMDDAARVEHDLAILAEMDKLAVEIGKKIAKRWPNGVSAVDAVREQRRDLF